MRLIYVKTRAMDKSIFRGEPVRLTPEHRYFDTFSDAYNELRFRGIYPPDAKVPDIRMASFRQNDVLTERDTILGYYKSGITYLDIDLCRQLEPGQRDIMFKLSVLNNGLHIRSKNNLDTAIVLKALIAVSVGLGLSQLNADEDLKNISMTVVAFVGVFWLCMEYCQRASNAGYETQFLPSELISKELVSLEDMQQFIAKAKEYHAKNITPSKIER